MIVSLVLWTLVPTLRGRDLPPVEAQPFLVLVEDLLSAMDEMGIALPASTREQLDQVLAAPSSNASVIRVQELLNAECAVLVDIPALGDLEVRAGPRPLAGGEGVLFHALARFRNETGQPLRAEIRSRADWLELGVEDRPPLPGELTGVEVEYRLLTGVGHEQRTGPAPVTVTSRSAGTDRSQDLSLPTGVRQTQTVTLDLTDVAGDPTTLALVFRDPAGNVHPPAMGRTEPDFHFQPQVYRRDGESITLPVDTYTVTWSRGPQSLPQTGVFLVDASTTSLSFQEARWVRLRQDHGLHGGDHHIHAAGCSHFSTPTCGVTPATMVLHCEGEDVNYGLSLVWQGGGCWDYQLGFFLGTEDPASTQNHRLTTGVELSGFDIPCSINGWGHVMPLGVSSLLSTTLTGWPHRSVEVFEWAKRENEDVVTGYAHSGAGMEPREAAERFRLPHHGTPRADSIGANGFLAADVALDVALRSEPDTPTEPPSQTIRRERAVDILGVGENPVPWDLTPWYHALNCGFRTRIAGETDFPCNDDQHVGDVRSYVKLGDGDPPTASFLAELEAGRSYVTGTADPTGEVHYLQFAVKQANDGSNVARLFSDPDLRLPGPMKVNVIAKALAYLDPAGTGNTTPLDQPPYWDPERARQPGTRDLDVELVLNGEEVARRTVTADGSEQRLDFGSFKIERSSWLALRTHGSSHTNPIFVSVAGQPFATSQRSADWFLRKAIPAAATHILARMAIWGAPLNEVDAALTDFQRTLATFQGVFTASPADWPTGALAGGVAAPPGPSPIPTFTPASVPGVAQSIAAAIGDGAFLPEAVQQRLAHLLTADSPDLAEIDALLRPYCWFEVSLNPESRVRVQGGRAARHALVDTPREGLVRVINEAGVRSSLSLECGERWGQWDLHPHPQVGGDLSGHALEYRRLTLTSHETGRRAARVVFHVGANTRDLGLRDRQTLVFSIDPP